MKKDSKDGKNLKKKKSKSKFPFKEKEKFPNGNPTLGDGSNDKSWFTRCKGVLDSVTLPQFLVRKGIPDMGGFGAKMAVPSVAAMQVCLTLGSNDQSGVSTAVKKLYSNLRRANTGSTVYSEQDLLHYVYNLSIAIAIDRYLRRAYGILTAWDGLDASKPMSYFKAMGLDFDTFRQNQANLRMLLNSNSERIHTLMAGKCALYERRAWMFDHIFKDGQTNKSQDIMFTLDTSVEYYDWATNSYLTAVIPLYPSSGVGRVYSQVETNYQIFMFNILNSNKVALISADIIKAYGLEQSDSYFSIIPENYKTPTVYNEEVLNEIQNAKCCGSVVHNIFDDGNGYLVEAPYINTSGSFSQGNPTYDYYLENNLINFYRNKIDITDYAVSTRLSAWLQHNSNTNMTDIVAFGSEIPMTINFVANCDSALAVAGNGLDAYGMSLFTYSPFTIIIYADRNRNVITESLWSYFDWLPMMYYICHGYYDSAGVTQYDFQFSYPLLDIDNYAILDSAKQLSNIHNACTLSLLWWPDVIKDTRVLTIK